MLEKERRRFNLHSLPSFSTIHSIAALPLLLFEDTVLTMTPSMYEVRGTPCTVTTVSCLITVRLESSGSGVYVIFSSMLTKLQKDMFLDLISIRRFLGSTVEYSLA